MTEVTINGMRLIVRAMRPGDTAFVKASYKQSQIWTLDPEDQDTGALFDYLGRRGEKLVGKATTRVLCDAEDNDVLLGWSSVDLEKNAAHFVYVKQNYHGIGLARLLLQGLIEPFAVTHWTPICERIAEKHPMTYKPSMLLGRREKTNGKRADAVVDYGARERGWSARQAVPRR